MYIYTYVYMAAPQKHRACNRPGRPFCDKACNRIGGLATNPPCDKPVEDYSTLHRGPRHGFATEGPRQRFVTDGGDGMCIPIEIPKDISEQTQEPTNLILLEL